MAANLLSYAGWTFLPKLVTGWIQSVYYGITIRAGNPKPQPGTPRYQKHQRRIYMTVVIVYLLYTIYEADYWIRQQGDFYQDLGLSPGVDGKTIKSKFRRLQVPSKTLLSRPELTFFRAAIHHPDKRASSEDSASAEARFVELKIAQDTLVDPVRRWAYERFGPDMLKWQHCSSIRDYLLVGLQVAVPMYAGSVIFMTILGVTGYLQWGRFWRYLTFIALFLLEYHTLTRPYAPPILTTVINPILQSLTTHAPILPFQLLALAHKSTLTLFMALSQIGALFPSPPTSPTSSSPLDLQQLNRLEQLSTANEVEASRLLALDMAPFVGDEDGVKELRGKVKEWLVTNTIRADPEVRDAVGRELGKRRAGAPPGARIVGT